MLLPSADIPVLVKHVTLAIAAKAPPPTSTPNAAVAMVVGAQNENFIRYTVMAVNVLIKQGYLNVGSSIGPAGHISMSDRGVLLSRQHELEGFGKTAQFNQRYDAASSTIVGNIGADDTVQTHAYQARAAWMAKIAARAVGARIHGSMTRLSVHKPEPKPKQEKPKKQKTSAMARSQQSKRSAVRATARPPGIKKAIPRRNPVRRRPPGRV